MSRHIEWFRDPRMSVAAPGDVESGEAVNDEAALVIEEALGGAAVIEVSEGYFPAFARRLREIADAFHPGAPRTVAISPEALLEIAADLREQGLGHVRTVETVSGEYVDLMTPATAEWEADQ